MAKTQAKKTANKSSNQNDNRPMGMSKITEEDENKAQDPDEEINSGFGSYLRSSEGQWVILSANVYIYTTNWISLDWRERERGKISSKISPFLRYAPAK